MELLLVTIKTVYGKEMIYPENVVAKIFADIAGQKTLSRATLNRAQSLGFKVEVKQTALDLS